MSYGWRVPHADLTEGHRLPGTCRLWPDPQVGPWKVTLEWAVIDGRPECVGFSIGQANPDSPDLATLTGSTIRHLKISEIVVEDRAGMVGLVRTEPVAHLRRSTAERMREAAEVYQAALRAGGKPTKAVAEHFGIGQGNASNLVARARAAGFLPPTSAGVPMA